MATRDIGIIVNGATGRLAQHQHLRNALMPIILEGGLPLANGDRLLPHLLLAGRDEARLKKVAETFGLSDYTTDISDALSNNRYDIYFDVASTGGRAQRLHRAIDAGKHIYSEKPLAASLDEALGLVQAVDQADLKNGMVCDKIFLPGLQKLKRLVDADYFGRVLSVRLEFGWWVFDGETTPSQRQSWNYKKSGGGGLTLDMFPHWSYMLNYLFGRPGGLFCQTATHVPTRWDEAGEKYDVDVEDASYALMELEDGAKVQILTSWATRIRREDMMTIQVDGSQGSALATLRDCWTQSLDDTPKPTWPQLNLDIPRADHLAEWKPTPDLEDQTVSFRVGWERFLRHVADGTAFPFPLMEGAHALQLIEAAYRSRDEGKWMNLEKLRSQ